MYAVLDVNILSLNVCGLKSKLMVKDFVEFIKKYDIVTLCETRCDDVDMAHVKTIFKDIGFELVYKNRSILSKYKSGGLAIAITNRKKITWKIIKNSFEALLSIKVDKSSLGTHKDLIITSVYIPPSHARYGNVLHFEEIDNFLLNYYHDDYFHLLSGDFNAHTGAMSDVAQRNADNNRYTPDDDTAQHIDFDSLELPERRANEDTTHDRSTYGKKLVEVCRNNYIMIYNGRLGEDRGIGKATTTYGTTIDYVIGSWQLTSFVMQFSVLDFDPLCSDVHCGLHTQLKFGTVVKSNMAMDDRNGGKEICLKQPGRWKDEKKDNYLNNIDESKINSLILTMDELTVDEVSYKVKQILIEPAVTVFQPMVKNLYKKKSNNACMESYDSQCWKSRKEYHKAKQKYNVRKSNANFVCMINKSKKYRQELKRVRIKQKNDMVNKLRANKIKDPAQYWKIIKGEKKKNDIPVTLENFYTHFKELSNEDYANERLVYASDNETPPILNDPITSQEIMKCITKLKNKKSAGVDMIVNEYIKTTRDVMCPLYIKLFNKILDSGTFPEEWLVGVIIPLYKNKGNTDDCNNYRGITLLSCVGKLFTSILNERLKQYSETYTVINENQAGFREEYSTLDHMFLLKCVIDLYKWKKKKLFCLFVDYSKAFDMVWREGLWYKLVKKNVGGKILNVIKSMYENTKSCVMLNQELSETFLCNVGVRQGENLSPLLFAYYVNDIEESLINKECKYINFRDDLVNNYIKLFILMYADDTVIMCDNEEEMKRVLTALSSYCQEWKLTLNCSKTKIVVFNSSKNNLHNYNFQYNNEKVEVINEYKYLGITFNYNGRFRNCQLQLLEQARRAMYSIIGTSRKFDLPVDMQLEMFHCMVSPILLYGSEVWGYNIARDVELLQLKYLKHVLFVHSKTCNDVVYGELGVYPLEISIKCRMINFWVKLLNGKNSKLSYLMYCCLLELYRLGTYLSPWLTCIRDICNNCGMSGVWQSQNVINATWFKKAIEQRLKDQWITTWYANLSLKTSCSSYNIFKHTYSMEEYLINLSKDCRISLTKIRASNNKLPITVGRYNNLRREERVCHKCNEGEVGDEYHVLLCCKNEVIVRLRNKYITGYFRENPSQFKFKLLMQSRNISVMRNLSLFVGALLKMFR